MYQRVFGVGQQGQACNGFRPLRASGSECPQLHQILHKIANVDLHQNLALGFKRQVEKIRLYFEELQASNPGNQNDNQQFYSQITRKYNQMLIEIQSQI